MILTKKTARAVLLDTDFYSDDDGWDDICDKLFYAASSIWVDLNVREEEGYEIEALRHDRANGIYKQGRSHWTCRNSAERLHEVLSLEINKACRELHHHSVSLRSDFYKVDHKLNEHVDSLATWDEHAIPYLHNQIKDAIPRIWDEGIPMERTHMLSKLNRKIFRLKTVSDEIFQMAVKCHPDNFGKFKAAIHELKCSHSPQYRDNFGEPFSSILSDLDEMAKKRVELCRRS